MQPCESVHEIFQQVLGSLNRKDLAVWYLVDNELFADLLIDFIRFLSFWNALKPFLSGCKNIGFNL